MSTADDLASRLYRMLSQHRDWSTDQIGEALGVTETAMKQAREELVLLGLLADAGGTRDAVVDPMRAIEALLARQAVAVEDLSRSAGDLAGHLDSIAGLMPALRASQHDVAMNTVLEGNENARAFLAELGSTVSDELLTVHSGGALPPEAIEAALPADLAVLARGVVVRTIYLSSAVRSLPTLGYLTRLAEAGAQVRIRETLPFRMVLADTETAVCSMRWAEGRSGAVVVRGAALVQLLRRIFEFCWAEAMPLETPALRTCATDGLNLDEEQRLMLRLLADGLTDQAIARQLGVAPRTFTRKLKQLFEALGVDSRFQAGVAAARAGLS